MPFCQNGVSPFLPAEKALVIIHTVTGQMKESQPVETPLIITLISSSWALII